MLHFNHDNNNKVSYWPWLKAIRLSCAIETSKKAAPREPQHFGNQGQMEAAKRLRIWFPGGSDSKASACNEDSWVRKITWRRKWQPTPVLVPGKSHGPRSLVGYSPWGHKDLDISEWLHFLSSWWFRKSQFPYSHWWICHLLFPASLLMTFGTECLREWGSGHAPYILKIVLGVPRGTSVLAN